MSYSERARQTFAAGEPVTVLGTADRIMFRGVVVYDAGPPAFVHVRGPRGVETVGRGNLRGQKKEGRHEQRESEDGSTMGGERGAGDPGEEGAAAGAPSVDLRGDAGGVEAAIEPGAPRSDAGPGADAAPTPVEDAAPAEGPEDGQADPGEDVAAPKPARGGAARGRRPPSLTELAGPTLEAIQARHREELARVQRRGELERAIEAAATRALVMDDKHARFVSAHEAYGVLAEEVAELFDEVRKKKEIRSKLAMRNEALDIAVVGLRIAAMYDDAAPKGSDG